MSEASIAGQPADWLGPLRSTAAFALSAVKLLAGLIYALSAPLRYPLYYVYAFVVFLLSPLRYMVNLMFGSLLWAMNLVYRLKASHCYCYPVHPPCPVGSS